MQLFRRVLGSILALGLVLCAIPTALASQVYTYQLSADSTEELSLVLQAISGQSFSALTAEQAQAYIEYFWYDCSFSALNGGRYPYTNAQGYWAGKQVTDGVYTETVSATGCFAYCKFVSLVMYDAAGKTRSEGESAGHITAEGLKSFLLTYAQAGEHLRLDDKHSVTVVSCNDYGFYFMDYAGDQAPRIALRFATYENFASYCNEKGRCLYLYEADSAVNDLDAVLAAWEPVEEETVEGAAEGAKAQNAVAALSLTWLAEQWGFSIDELSSLEITGAYLTRLQQLFNNI